MTYLRSWDDLRPYGIDLLTGEACGYAMRLLCDVTERGARLVEAFLGNNVTLKRGSNWNRGTADDPHVASVLLTRNVFPDLAAFTLLHTEEPGPAIVTLGDEWTAAAIDADHFERYQMLDAGRDDSKSRMLIRRTWRRPAERLVERNRHAMSGRTV